MALAIASMHQAKWPEGKKSVRIVNLTGDTAYPTGGSAITENFVGFQPGNLMCVIPLSTKVYTTVWDGANKKLVVYPIATPGTEVANNTDLSGTTFQILVIGV